MPLLHPGDPFPQLALNVPGGQALTVPDVFAGDFAVVLFYRGSWCPYCNAQLRAFQRSGQALEDTGIRVAALSVDDEAATAELISKHGLTYPVGYGADAPAIAAATGAFVNPDPVFLQSDRLRPRPCGQRRGQRVLQRRDRAPRPRRRHRPRPLPARALADRDSPT